MSKEHICISLSDDLLRAVQVKGSGASARVTNIVSRSTKDVSDQEMSGFIQSALVGFNIKSSSISLVALPNFVTTKNIDVPSTNAEEIKSIVNLQASRHTPYSRDEIQVGHVNLGIYKKTITKVLLVIANKHVLKEKLIKFEQSGSKIKNVLFSAEAIVELYSRAMRLKKNSPPVGVIDIGSQSTDFIIVSRGKPVNVRNIPIGREQLNSDAEIAREQLTLELKNTIESYQAEDAAQIPKSFVLTSNDDLNKFVETHVKENLGWEIKIVSYLDYVKASKGLLNKIAQEMGSSSFLDIIASASEFSKNSINLIPEEIQFQKFIKDQTREIFKAFVLVVVILCIVATIFGLKWHFNNSALNQLKSDYAQNHQEVVLLKQKAERIRVLSDYLTDRMVSLDVIYELYQKIPRDIYLNSIVMVDHNTVSIQGISQMASQVYKLRNILKGSELFEDVKVTSQSARKDRGEDVAGFEIELIIKE